MIYTFFRWEENFKMPFSAKTWVYKGKLKTRRLLTKEELTEELRKLKNFEAGYWKAQASVGKFKPIDLDYVGWW